MSNNVILVTGTSGTGKTTVLRELDKRGFATIGIDETPHLTYWVNKDGSAFVGDAVFDQEFLDNHEWICDITLLEQLLKEATHPVFVCGSCDNIRECMELCDTTLLLHCPPEVFMARIDARTDNEYGKTAAAKQALLGYYQQYYDECTKAGAVTIDAARPVDEVAAEVVSYVE